MSNDDPMWYSLPYHVTILQKMYGPIPVLPTTSDQMEAKPVFPERCHRKRGERKKNRYTSDLTQGAQNYSCKLCGDEGHYASKCSKPQVSYVINEYESFVSKYLHGLHGVKVLQMESDL